MLMKLVSRKQIAGTFGCSMFVVMQCILAQWFKEKLTPAMLGSSMEAPGTANVDAS
jgi:hypothetical protein